MENTKYINLILRDITGNISTSESQKLNILRDKDLGVNDEAILIEDIWNACELYKPGLEFDAENAFNKFKQENIVTQEQSPKIIELKSSFPILLKYAASLLILAFAAYGVTTYIDQPEYQTAQNQFKQIELADGSKLYLSGATMVDVNRKFAKTNRSLAFEGKAFFDVVEDESLPFIIDMDDKKLQVIGTSFNVINRGNGDITVEVMTGQVKFLSDDGSESYALADEKLFYNSKTGEISKSKITSINTFNWSKRVLSFNNTPLDEVLSDLELYYEISIDKNSINTEGCFFTSPYLKNAPLSQTLDILNTTNGVSVIADPANSNGYILQEVNCK